MNRACVYRNADLAGILEKTTAGYRFSYVEAYWRDPTKPAVSLTLPKQRPPYESPHLFAFFFNLLSEGVNLALQSRTLRIDERDYFGLLLATAGTETIGAVRVVPCPEER
ncbi:MAG: HipA N-terminal domain-containing protein [Cytophagales bacterium]|nr:HipA N-terminal domain-containing protein [Cytophagales bacterium]